MLVKLKYIVGNTTASDMYDYTYIQITRFLVMTQVKFNSSDRVWKGFSSSASDFFVTHTNMYN